MNLRSKLLTICFLILLIPSLIIGLIGYSQGKLSMEELGKTTLKNSVRTTIELIHQLDQEVKAGRLDLAEAQERVKVAILGEKNADGTRPVNQNVNLGKYGYIYIYDEKGNQVASPDGEGENLWNLQDSSGRYLIQENIELSKTGGAFMDTEWYAPDDETKMLPKIAYTEFDSTWGWAITATTYYMDFNSPAQDVLRSLILTLVAAIIAGGTLIILFTRSITRPLGLLAKQTEQIAQGNLQVDPITVKNQDEIGTLVKGFEQMVGSIRQLLGQISATSHQVASSSEQLFASAEQSSKATEHIVIAIQEVASGSESQTAHSEEAVHTTKTMEQSIQTIANHCAEVSASAQTSSAQAEEGNQSLQQVVGQMERIQATVENSSTLITKLNGRSEQIGQIIDVIRGIADQTNLLALNAAIEAARAGEHGRGFAVVADEVRKLAEQSTQSAQQISDLIIEIQADTNNSTSSMNQVQDEVRVGLEIVHSTEEKFGTILLTLREVAEQIQDVSNTTLDLSANSKQITLSMEEVNQIAKTSSSHSQSVAASGEEQLASMEEIAASAASLSKVAEEMQTLVAKFKV
ncbi:hypothetical protein J31TS6_59770 [Brevibacillus reuszeri]|uniref:methyl-accepting chemotaxis protein n=1 Tax=Brevibacillus reuszeri TaxID=54915 RepID=UPI001B0DB115|nr:methyl-accepting chemotaxis protein [Brevibacillus reuszeri]GIO09949.1 hypothetical protein J31TS6_59770 [Brevibacillus reuszeri]